jgi:hypothetical protein
LADERRGRVAEGWRQIQDESQGLLRVAIIDIEDAVTHLARAIEGDVESRRLIALMDGTFERLDSGELVCLLCGAELSLTALPHAIVAIHAARLSGQRRRASAVLASAAIRARRAWRRRCTSFCGQTCFRICGCCRRSRRAGTPDAPMAQC